MNNKIKTTAIAVYTLGVVVTFGHAWNRDFSTSHAPEEAAMIASTFSAVAWPFYWSTVAWR